MKLLKFFKQMCTPAQIYFGISFLSILIMMIQNIQDQNSYCCGLIKAPSPVNNIVYFVFKIIYVLVWTYLLNLLCKKGYKTMSWVILLLPLIAMFILVGLVIISLQRL
tara:strand:- start:280 stop:603 length:324 start_codon:yes stop_codon:yes gene_type:complete